MPPQTRTAKQQRSASSLAAELNALTHLKSPCSRSVRHMNRSAPPSVDVADPLPPVCIRILALSKGATHVFDRPPAAPPAMSSCVCVSMCVGLRCAVWGACVRCSGAQRVRKFDSCCLRRPSPPCVLLVSLSLPLSHPHPAERREAPQRVADHPRLHLLVLLLHRGGAAQTRRNTRRRGGARARRAFTRANRAKTRRTLPGRRT